MVDTAPNNTRQLESKFSKQAFLLLLISNAGTVISLVGLGLVGSIFFDASLGDILLFQIGTGLLLTLISSRWQQKLLTKPSLTILSAVQHMQPDTSPDTPPDLKDVHVGRELTQQTMQAVFTLASGIHQSQASLEEEIEQLHSFIEASGVAMLAIDADGKTVRSTLSAQKLLGYTEDELASLPFESLYNFNFTSKVSLKQWQANCRTSKIEAQTFWDHVTHQRNDGERRLFDLAAHFHKQESHGYELILIFIDRTDEYLASEEQTDFVAMAAHELRAPITVLRGTLDTVQKRLSQANNHTYDQQLERMTVSANHLSSYIHTILNVAKIDQGTLKIHPQKADWRQILEASTRDLKTRAHALQRQLTVIPPDQELLVDVDTSAITQVLVNVIDNAIKYSLDDGKITVRTSVTDGFAETTIEDTGIGIPEALIENLFKKFYRSHRSKTNVSGTGLGLYLSRAIVEAHGGSIWVRSKEGQGSTFGFTIPLYDPQNNDPKAPGDTSKNTDQQPRGWIKNHSMIRK